MTLTRKAIKPGAGFKPRTKPMKSASFARVAAKEAGAVAELRKTLTSARPKMTPIRRAAKGQECTFRFAVCNRNPETTVWAHSNNYRDGKCAGKKARDEEGCFACSACHFFYDGGYANAGWTREAVEARFDLARAESQETLKQKGLMP